MKIKMSESYMDSTFSDRMEDNMRVNDIIKNCSGNRILVKFNDTYTDVTNMNAVLYGVSLWAFDTFICSGILNLKHIIDKDPTKIGSYVKLDGKYYQVESPDILKDLDSSENYICLFTKRWHGEIRADIERIVNGGGKFITATRRDVRHSYSSLRDMFDYDGYCREMLNCFYRRSSWMTDRISTIIKQLELDVRLYMPIAYIGASKLNILLLSDSGNYVISYRDDLKNRFNLNTQDGLSANNDNLMHYTDADSLYDENDELYYFIVGASPITLYIDREGFVVQEFCSGGWSLTKIQ
jgi:hypothetical protein